MIYNKMLFSLAGLVVVLALAFVAPHAFAAEFGVSLSVVDISYAEGNQLEYTGQPDNFPYGNPQDHGNPIRVKVTFDQVVNGTNDPTTPSGANFDIDDVIIQVYNEFGAHLGNVSVEPPNNGGTTSDAFADLAGYAHVVHTQDFDGKNYYIQFHVLSPVPEARRRNTKPVRVVVGIKKHSVEVADPTYKIGTDDRKNAAPDLISFELVHSEPDPTIPRVAYIELANNLLVPAAGFTGESFQAIVTLTEQPKENKFTADHLNVTEATVTSVVYLGARDAFAGGGVIPAHAVPTGRDYMHHRYLVTIEPKYENKNDIVIKVKEFEDQRKAYPNDTPAEPSKYIPPTSEIEYVEGFDKLTVKVGKEADPKALAAGHEVKLTNKRVIPAGGYLIVATATADTGINLPDAADADDNTPKIDKRSPAELKYNAISVAIPNLEAFLGNGGTIDLVSPDAGLMISEIMWGSDASLETNSNSQWIEIMNTTAADIATGDGTHKLIFYGPNEAAPAKVAVAAVAETATTKAQAASMALPEGIVDRVGTIDDKGGYWSLAGKGQSGRTGYGETKTDFTVVVPTLELISMYRVTKADATGDVPLGNTSAAWMQSTPPAVNMDPAKGGNRIASPGADEIETAAEKAAREAAEKAKTDAEATAKAKAADTSVMMPKVGQIYISEIMFAGGGTLPQWIEISNGSRTEEVNLSGWTLTVNNAAADADVSVGGSITFTIPEGTKIHPSGQNDTPSTILVVTERGRNNIDNGAMGEGQIINLWTDQQTELILAGVTKRRYSLLSGMAFQITLAPSVPIEPPATKAAAPTTAAEIAAERAAAADKKAADAKAAAERAAATDMVGNLGADGAATWALPMSEDGGRSSIIRRHVPVSIGPAEPEDGSMMDSWALASDTSFAQVTHIRAASYYGAANDVGTPGFRAGGALPVELSHFRPARQKETGQVVITWSTQSELNNAGFFIKRSQQRTGEFKVINATMIPGAGTTSEKQFYTYTDTTAQPNVVYYYQIEDVSLDGNRQTLTRGIRLKGHIGAAGKEVSTWGELKTSNQ